MFAKWFRGKQRSAPMPPISGDLSNSRVVSTPAASAAPAPLPPVQRAEFTSWSPIEPVDFGPVGLEGYAKQLDGHKHVVERPTPIEIGRAAIRPPESLMREFSRRMSACGATSVYWFWMSVAGDQPHMGLAVAPNDDAVVRRMGESIEPLWRQFSPDNSIVDILRLGSELDATICTYGEVLVPWPSPSMAERPAS